MKNCLTFRAFAKAFSLLAGVTLGVSTCKTADKHSEGETAGARNNQYFSVDELRGKSNEELSKLRYECRDDSSRYDLELTQNGASGTSLICRDMHDNRGTGSNIIATLDIERENIQKKNGKIIIEGQYATLTIDLNKSRDRGFESTFKNTTTYTTYEAAKGYKYFCRAIKSKR